MEIVTQIVMQDVNTNNNKYSILNGQAMIYRNSVTREARMVLDVGNYIGEVQFPYEIADDNIRGAVYRKIREMIENGDETLEGYFTGILSEVANSNASNRILVSMKRKQVKNCTKVEVTIDEVDEVYDRFNKACDSNIMIVLSAKTGDGNSLSITRNQGRITEFLLNDNFENIEHLADYNSIIEVLLSLEKRM